jgi:UDP-2,3-diacylglucosamine pyrophosphatase LpxH
VKSTLVLSDVHLGEGHGRDAGCALARLLTEHTHKDLIFAGDTFDLTLGPKTESTGETLCRILAHHEPVRAALRAHLGRGNRVTVLPGNHDAALKQEETAGELLKSLEPPRDEALSVRDWFTNFGPAHIQHGHLYDADNAFAHPLAPFRIGAEPLGTALMRHFVGPSGALSFAHAHETSPVRGLVRAFREFGPRAPQIILLYFRVALALCLRAARKDELHADEQEGERALKELARKTGLPEEQLRALAELRESPTHLSAKETWHRLYLDQVSAGALFTFAATQALSNPGLSLPPALVATGLFIKRKLEPIDYHERMNEAARQAAHKIRELLGAELVVFGHTHSAHEEPGYVNLGSFGVARRARPYLVLREDGHHELRRFEAT